MVVVGFMIITFQINKKEMNSMRTLHIFEDKPVLSDDMMKEIPVDIFSYNADPNKYKITIYPTYVLVKTNTDEVLLITNNIDDLRNYVPK